MRNDQRDMVRKGVVEPWGENLTGREEIARGVIVVVFCTRVCVNVTAM